MPAGFLSMLSRARYKYFGNLPQALAETSAPTSIRVNLAKGVTPDEGYEKVKWCGGGIYLDRRPQFTFHPAIHQGLFYVQDASSMALSAVIRYLVNSQLLPDKEINVLDACAAPGGKTTVMADELPENAAIIANEYDYRRADILAENIAKWGLLNVAVTQGDTVRFNRFNNVFDLILVDAPCSGEGMMRKDPVAINQWSPQLVDKCAARQQEILTNIWPALKPGGVIIYSTCTFNTEENESIVDFICNNLGAETISIPELDGYDDIFPNACGHRKCYRFIPGLTRGEGLFMSVMIKNDGHVNTSRRRKQSDLFPAVTKKEKSMLDSAVGTALEGDIRWLNTRDPGVYTATTPGLESLIDTLGDGVVFTSRGMPSVVVSPKQAIPTQQLALCNRFKPSMFPVRELGYDEAMSYLRGDALSSDNGLPKGINLVTFKNRPLGWVKNLPNRANNLYPKAWRVITDTVLDPAKDLIPDSFLNNY